MTHAPDEYRLVVRFISIGTGIDQQAFRKFEELRKAATKKGKSLAVKRHNWGREGERNLCMRLDEINEARAEIFVVKVKGTFRRNKRVQVAEFAKCDQP